MHSRRDTPKSRVAILASLVVIVGLGCLCLPGNITPTGAPPLEPSPTTGAVPFTPGTIVETGDLNAQGPWLLIETDIGLWAANPDGSGLTQLTDVDYWTGNLQAAVQPGGDLVVFLTGTSDLRQMALNALMLPSGETFKITDLTSAESEEFTSPELGDPGFEALRAVGEQTNYAWSPDGTRLAFSGIIDGPSADIYLYRPATYQIQRVSQDEIQDFSPSWSPDGNHLLYLAARGFGTGAGMAMSGVWAAAGDGSSAAQLYSTDSGGEEVVGWLDNTSVVLFSFDQPCGEQELRLYDVVSKQETMLNEGCFASAASGRGAVLYSNDNGVYLLTAEDPTPAQVDPQAGARIDPWEPGDQIFTVRFGDNAIATFGTNLEYEHLVSPVTVSSYSLDVAVYGLIWGWTSTDEGQPGVWITGPGIEIGQIYTGQAAFPIWDLHNNLIFFAPQDSGGYAIYRTTFDSYYRDLTQVNSIDAGVWALAWLGRE